MHKSGQDGARIPPAVLHVLGFEWRKGRGRQVCVSLGKTGQESRQRYCGFWSARVKLFGRGMLTDHPEPSWEQDSVPYGRLAS